MAEPTLALTGHALTGLAQALWLGYRVFRLLYRGSLVTPERVAWTLRRAPRGAPGYQDITAEQVRCAIADGKSPDLELASCGASWIVVERPMYPGLRMRARYGDKIMWGGRREDDPYMTENIQRRYPKCMQIMHNTYGILADKECGECVHLHFNCDRREWLCCRYMGRTLGWGVRWTACKLWEAAPGHNCDAGGL